MVLNPNNFKNVEMSKQDMYTAINGKCVKCIYIENEDVGTFSVHDINADLIYILDCIWLNKEE